MKSKPKPKPSPKRYQKPAAPTKSADSKLMSEVEKFHPEFVKWLRTRKPGKSVQK